MDTLGKLPNALVQLQAHYHHCGEAASEKCLSAATFVSWPAGGRNKKAPPSRSLWFKNGLVLLGVSSFLCDVLADDRSFAHTCEIVV
jgi:hypothetical protein